MNAKPQSADDADDDISHAPQAEILPPIKGDVSPIVAAEINQQVATAKRFPRRRDVEITNEIMGRAAFDEETAAECMYSLPRAGKDITGPSIRFAELVFVSFGNLRAGARFVELDTKDPRRAAVVIEGVCLDLQTNVAQNIPVRRSIVGKKGMFGADMTNIAFSAGAAIARREAILKTVPKAIWGPAYKRVISVLQGDANTLKDRRAKLIDAFGRRDIKPERVFAAIGVKSIEDVTIEHLPRLFGMLTALADGSETPESLFAVAGQTQPGERHNPLADDDGEADGTAANGGQPANSDAKAQNSADSGQKAQAADTAQAAQASPPAAKSEAAATEQPAKPAQEAQRAAPQAGGASDGQPTDEKGYEDYAKAWMGEAKTVLEVNDRYASERKLRTACGVTAAGIERLSAIKAATIAELKSTGG